MAGLQRRRGRRESFLAINWLGLAKATIRAKNLALTTRICEDSLVMPKPIPILREDLPARTLKAVFREELAKAASAIVALYETMREIDVRTMEILIALLGRPK
jgi:hypothetical protein